MRRISVTAAVLIAVSAPWALPREDKGLGRLTVPDDKPEALKAIHEWLTARGMASELRKDLILHRHAGVLINIIPIVNKDELDRLRIVAFYNPKPEFKNKPEFADHAAKLNGAQNFCQVFVDTDGDIGIGSNMTFMDEFTSREFDACMDLFAAVVKQRILTAETLKLVK